MKRICSVFANVVFLTSFEPAATEHAGRHMDYGCWTHHVHKPSAVAVAITLVPARLQWQSHAASSRFFASPNHGGRTEAARQYVVGLVCGESVNVAKLADRIRPRAVAEIGPAVRADFRRLYPANAKTPTCCPSDDNRTKVTNSVTSARSLWWHVGPYFWPADLTRTADPVVVEGEAERSGALRRLCVSWGLWGLFFFFVISACGVH